MSTTIETVPIDLGIADPLPFCPRGPVSAMLQRVLVAPATSGLPVDAPEIVGRALAETGDTLRDDDLQLALFLMYALHYGSLPGLDASWEWEPSLIAARGRIERAFEAGLRDSAEVIDPPEPDRDAVARWLFDLTAPTAGPGMSRYVAKKASLEQLREFLILRTVYTLREADPHSWAIPRLSGRSKAALVEIQSDEYGGGDPARVHATIFAQSVRGAGLDDTYGAYIDMVPAVVLASHNAMSLFGLHRRLRGAIVGHLAAFEMTSSIPNRSYGDGFRRLGFGTDVTWYFDEHVEADAVHEQIAGRDLAGSLAEDEPDLLPDILFGARACLVMDDLVGDHVLAAWEAGRSALRGGVLPDLTA
ncbi:iron-containing redox enzyme family protein [Microbacterium sp. BDGP8]|uniref:iron-containing redox enzyme family protein n=1 Tax=Microbacterium sp. BDGP8 TaxID=3035531 RepID=UPI00249DA911|nr:iron-containing redox enzyme family protein [Microbacterium sp. BDGP8]WHE35034.1 iron-containing redox enzyme family protein [Microbacterium sp. BDGP8]